jgi:hypothetical protein
MNMLLLEADIALYINSNKPTPQLYSPFETALSVRNIQFGNTRRVICKAGKFTTKKQQKGVILGFPKYADFLSTCCASPLVSFPVFTFVCGWLVCVPRAHLKSETFPSPPACQTNEDFICRLFVYAANHLKQHLSIALSPFPRASGNANKRTLSLFHCFAALGSTVIYFCWRLADRSLLFCSSRVATGMLQFIDQRINLGWPGRAGTLSQKTNRSAERVKF